MILKKDHVSIFCVFERTLPQGVSYVRSTIKFLLSLLFTSRVLIKMKI